MYSPELKTSELTVRREETMRMGGKRGVFATVGILAISAALVAESRPCGGTWFAGNFNMNGCSFDPMRLQSCVRGKRPTDWQLLGV